ncbi:CMGC/CDK/CRK7 protein kinase [Saprolegnia parasitica CBS 223.65]|uniref:Cyclin-dependent kinase 2 homolog n=1 Tax=Saprolegnia parasitica (strain CBS 223.65) TaxID=695850 RepID=A0A067CZ01_SAPPC|nr:CMGC/CDK/CRK7 protein kinase [Saprolegnia parasitica CBS 223.65]KDO34505.1 CMGC/CDK/CRK7 protein kinase [Saprolegnia parasitica CBS 223.65]|eukprot:XP_012194184.1 CMGC/CDK/CRK7 protein kinase [Saprolegnia parasitica CBS 223.65]
MSLNLPQHGWDDGCLDVYEKIECIGAGTYGQVYLAAHRDTGDMVALKKIRSLNEVQGLPVTSIREIKVLKSLRHRNLVGLKEVIVTNEVDDPDDDFAEKCGPGADFTTGCIYLVLEYVEHDLTGLIDRQYPFSDVEIKSIMKQLCEVLVAMHGVDIIHRDIKCSNLLMTPKHVLKVADFGLARSIGGGEKNFTNKVVTLWYRSPELLLGATSYDSMVDMWSVGCVFAELYIGRPLFAGKNEMEQIRRIFEVCGSPTQSNWPDHGSLPFASKFVPDATLPNRLADFLKRETQARYPTRELPTGALDLMTSLLQLDPKKRLTASAALQSRYFRSEPLAPADPESLPPLSNLPPSHEFQTKKIRKEQASKRNLSASMSISSESRPLGSPSDAPLPPKRAKTSSIDLKSRQ